MQWMNDFSDISKSSKKNILTSPWLLASGDRHRRAVYVTYVMAALFHGEWLKNKCGVEKNTEMHPQSPTDDDGTEVAHKKCKKEVE